MWEKMLLPKAKGTACLEARIHKVKKAGGDWRRRRGGTFPVENAIDPLP